VQEIGVLVREIGVLVCGIRVEEKEEVEIVQ